MQELRGFAVNKIIKTENIQGNLRMVILSDYWSTLQKSLIPFMEQVAETRLTEKEKRLVAIMDVISVEKRLDHTPHYGRGRKPYDLHSMTREFIAKAALNIS